MDPALVDASFASMSGSPMTGDMSTREFTVWQDSRGNITAPVDARKTDHLGGWSLDVLHRYDPESRTLTLGTGEERTGAKDVDNVARTVAGGGSLTYFGGDGGPALDALLNSPRGVAAGPEGTLYIADTGNYRVRKISGDGTINTVAGNGSYPNYYTPNNDGKPAKEVPLDSPEYITPAPDGSFYITDRSKHRIRKVSPDGIITTVAGNGTYGFSGDGGAATQAQLYSPAATALGPDGSLYIADTSNYRIRKVAPGGTISTVAGTGVRGFSGDGGPAAQAQFGSISGLTGFGDAQSFNGTYWIRETYGGNSAIDIYSGAYSAGRFVGNWLSPSVG